jgi:hypothetical protein
MDEFELKDPWHYPRPKLAEKYLKVFDIGLIAAQGLFAKRRMGKSEFLEKDLLPAARGHGDPWRRKCWKLLRASRQPHKS